ncbi:hypothetical protein [uncultured Alteromonas sp.]|uniref:hypothetical protein n=1 Tax=uncultured Alteromonas sp. TaxID=179113 RepID=UPI00258281A4|nr:hypothetical protein [uncultured Alteromonas sp.]
MVRQIHHLVASNNESGNGKGNMDLFSDTLFALSVFVGFAFIVGFFALMYLWARKQKGAINH